MKEESIVYSFQEEGHAMPYRASWGSTWVGQGAGRGRAFIVVPIGKARQGR